MPHQEFPVFLKYSKDIILSALCGASTNCCSSVFFFRSEQAVKVHKERHVVGSTTTCHVKVLDTAVAGRLKHLIFHWKINDYK